MTVSDFALYHWSPSSRRKQIIRYGLRPNSLSSCRLWKPPYVCFADSPLQAWSLIGRFRPEIEHWDLWWTTSSAVSGYEIIPYDNGDPKEYRVYERVFKRDLWLVGSRQNEYHRTEHVDFRPAAVRGRRLVTEALQQAKQRKAAQ